MVKIGIIGCGGMGGTHNMALKQISSEMDVEVVAVADLFEEKMEKMKKLWPNAISYKTGKELIDNSDCDTIYICLPSYLHSEHIIYGLKHNKNVFSEKPICLTKEEIKALREVNLNNNKVFVGHVVRFFPEYLYLKECYDNKTFGKLLSLDMKRSGGFPRWSWDDWFGTDSKCGSVVLDLHIHDVDYLTYLFGANPTLLSKQTTTFESGMINHINAQFQFEDTVCNVLAHWDRVSCYAFRAEFVACFENATIEFSNNVVKVYTTEEKVFEPKLIEVKTEHEIEGINITNVGPYYLEDKFFMYCIINDEEVEDCNIEQSTNSVAIAIDERS
ncbi:MAG: Gfo/Idh/MocA family oxidoreductase [Spirochaetales bacterium]|nr:Gfo/Idh/MocA family oxidoreductase [Spirochaetales bacterium]